MKSFPLEFLQDSAKHLHLEGSIDALHPVFWDTYHYDQRVPLHFTNFSNKLNNTENNDVTIFQGDHVPMTLLHMVFAGKPVAFMVSARPFIEREVLDYFSKLECENPFEDLDTAGLTVSESKRLFRSKLRKLQKSGEWTLPVMFQPHIRGLYLGSLNSNDTYVYSPLNLMETVVDSSGKKIKTPTAFSNRLRHELNTQGYNYINLLDYPISIYDRIKHLYSSLQNQKVITTKRDQGSVCLNNPDLERRLKEMNLDAFHTQEINLKGSIHVPFFDFESYVRKGVNVWSYLPLKMETGYELFQTVPLVITNSYNDVNQPVVLGVYGTDVISDDSSYNVRVLPIQDPYFSIAAAQAASSQLSLDFTSVFWHRQKGSPKLVVPDPVLHKSAFDKFYKDETDDW